MASLTIAIDPETLEAAQLEAERRKTSLEQMFAEYVASVAHDTKTDAEREGNRRRLLDLMYSSPLATIDRPLTREEIYAERTRWPRS